MKYVAELFVIHKYIPLYNQVMKKSVINAGFEKEHAVPAYSEGKKAMARKRRVSQNSVTPNILFQMSLV